MTQKDENKDEILDMENELSRDIDEAEQAEENLEKNMQWLGKIQEEIIELKQSLARSQADYQNLIKRFERDKEEMGSYLTWNIVLKMLPFIDNLERMMNATPEDMKSWALYEWVRSTLSGITKTLENMWVKAFDSIWKDVDTDFHDVMSQMPWEQWKIIQEFERWYMLWDKVIRHAKVVVWSWE